MAGEGDHGPEGLCAGQTLSGHHHTAQQVSATLNTSSVHIQYM